MKKTFLFSLLTFLTVTFSFAQNVGINADGSLPNSSAMLDVKSANKGLLIPRVALTGTGDVTTIPTPATSLMVYNTTAAGTGTTAVVAGYYYWNGTAWVRIVSSTTPTTTFPATTAYKTLIPFASGTSLNVTTSSPGAPKQVGVVGFGNSSNTNSSTTTPNNSTVDLTFGPNYAFVVPSSGTITEISGFFGLVAVNVNLPTTVSCQLYFSQFNNTFIPIPGTSVSLGNPFFGADPGGSTSTGSLTGLNISVAAGTRILMVVSASNSFGSTGSISGYFSGGVNMVIQ